MFSQNVFSKGIGIGMLISVFGLFSFVRAYTLPDTVANVFPDANLAAVVAQGLGVSTGTVVNQSDLNQLTGLFATGKNIAALTGLSALKNLQYLNLSGNKLSGSLAVDTFSGLSGLVDINLSFNKLDSLPVGLFSGLINLKNLYISSNVLTSLPVGVFSGLINLQLLWLHYNSLTAVPLGLFDGLTSLTNLALSYNQLVTVPVGVFSGLDKIQNLYLNSNKIPILWTGIFAWLTAMIHLEISNNQLTWVPEDMFLGFKDLDYLRMDQNLLPQLPPKIFSGLINLTSLYLYQNKLTTLPRGLFSDLWNLKFLQLSNNILVSVPDDIFHPLVNIVTLRLDVNKLTSVPQWLYAGLTKLTLVWLNSNSLRTLPAGLFSGLSSMTGITVHTNQFRTFPVNLFDGVDMAKLQTFSYRYNCITSAALDANLYQTLLNKSTGVTQTQYVVGSANCPVTTWWVFADADVTKNELLWVGYQQWTWSLTSTSSTTMVGNKPIDMSYASGQVAVPLIVQSSGATNTYEAEFTPGTVIKTASGDVFTGILTIPTIKSTGVVVWVTGNVLSVAAYGSTTPLVFKDQNNNPAPVTLRMPAPGMNSGDLVKVVYSENNWWAQATQAYATVFLINGIPYVEFTTTHFTDFAVAGFGTGMFVVNMDAASTTSPFVTLNLYHPNAAVQMRFSNDGSSWSSWESYAATKSWSLVAGSGTKTVYVDFDENSDSVSDLQVTDTIVYTELPAHAAGWSVDGQLIFQITTGSSYCDYGKSISFWEKSVSSTAITFSGDFVTNSGSTTWRCVNNEGISAGGNLYIQMSGDLVNDASASTIIQSGNVQLSFGTTVFDWSLTGIIRSGSWLPLNTPISMFGTTTTADLRIGSMSTDNVQLQVVTNPNQAPGKYTGTLVITLPW